MERADRPLSLPGLLQDRRSTDALFCSRRRQVCRTARILGAAWRVAARDDFIGWTEAQRKDNLHLVVDNSRFLVLPWVHSKSLASRVLSHAARNLPDYWQERYHYRPLLMETFVEKHRFAATCYRAANWACLGETLGRGKRDRKKAFDKPVKTIWVYALARRFKERLCQ